MAHTQATVPVEAAASLFGEEDGAAVDLVASAFDISQSEADRSPVQSSSHQSGVASSLFEAGPTESTVSLFQTASHDSFLFDGSGVLSTSESAPEAAPTSQTNDASTAYQSQGWYDDHGQWHLYDDQNQYTSTYDYASQRSSTDPLYMPHSEFYPQPHDQTGEQATAYATPHDFDLSKSQTLYTPQQSSYQYNHAPPAPQAQSPYVPFQTTTQGAAYTQSAYNSYAPGYQSRADSQSGDGGAYGGRVKQSQSPQSAKDVKAYRPTTLNAYDPPIPSKTRSKVRTTFVPPPPAVIPNGTHYQYASAPQPPPSIPPPPPLAKPAGLGMGIPVPSPNDSVFNRSSNAREITYGEGSSARRPTMDRAPEAVLSYDQEHGNRYGASDPYQSNASSWSATAPTNEYTQSDLPREEVHYEPEREDSVSESEAFGFEFSSDVDGFEVATSTLVHASDASTVTDNSSFGGQHSSIGLDDQSLESNQLPPPSADIGSPSPSPPPLTGSPVNVSHTSQATADVGTHNGFAGDPPSYDPYHPARHSRENSDAAHTGGAYSVVRPTSVKPRDLYLPAKVSTTFQTDSISSIDARDGSAYNDSSLAGAFAAPAGPFDPYAPTTQLRRTQSQQSEFSYGGDHISHLSYSNDSELGSVDGRANPPFDPDATASYSNVLTAPTYAPYAPSPSLLGTNDPLGRSSARVPVITFGFGGKLVSCFHSAGDTVSGFDVSLTARQSTSIQIRTLHDVIPASAMDSFASSFPGPLFSDPGAASISLARTVGVGTASNVKAKKTLVSKWLEERAEELSSGVAYIPSGSQERSNVEGKLVLVRLLKAMVDNDGQLSGSLSIEWAVRSALLPHLGSERPATSGDRLPSKDHAVTLYPPALADFNEPSLAVYHLRPSALDRIQSFLLRGERRLAYHYALDEKLWAHAMLIASSIDTQAWKEVVNEFIHSELTVKPPLPLAGLKQDTTVSQTNGRESLRVAYSLFAGQGAASVQELLPLTALAANKDSLVVPPPALHATPMTPNFPQPALPANIPPEALAKWQEAAAVMAFSQNAADSAALTTLGDYLTVHRWFEAAHACYLLSPRTSSLGGAGVPSVRIVLVGCESPNSLRNFNKDLDVTLLSEIVEFALSLSPSKGQETFGGLPHLQAYKLIRASHLAEMGHVETANRYCEAIGSVIRASTRGSQFYTPTFIGELKDLSDRLTAAPQQDTTVSWISRKMTKPSLDTIGSWLEGHFSKLIVGDGEDGAEPPANESSKQSKPAYGPFSHYSTISSVVTSASPSPSPTPYGRPNSTAPNSGMPPASLGSGTVQIDRASSAMDHLRPRRASPVPRVASASAATMTFAQAASQTRQTHEGASEAPESDGADEVEGQEVSWWGSSSLDRSGPTPTAATFHNVEEIESSGNFVSLMDTFTPGIKAMATAPSQSQSRDNDEEGKDDLGLGNSSSTTPKPDGRASNEEKEKEQGKPTPEVKRQSSSWFGRWWNRSSEPTPGPIKAKLGEETSFYYDKELKRWVNRKAGATESSPTPPPPPPSRPRTASPAPGPLGSKATDAPLPSRTPPQARPASAAEVSLPPRKAPRIRSNLVPKEDSAVPGSAPPSATSFENSNFVSGPPPISIGRPKSSASKRNVRNRYVDVFQQQKEA